LYRDHDLCRKKLDALESALTLGEELQLVVRELCFTLSVYLREHIRRESGVIASCDGPLSAKELVRFADGHGEESHAFHTTTLQLTGNSPGALRKVYAALPLAITWLRYHMDEQEYKLFPVLAWVLRHSGAVKPDELMMRGMLSEDMTVQHVIEGYPATEPFFRDCFVDPCIEGSDALDEVAWRHGLDSGQFLAQLETVIIKLPHRLSPLSSQNTRTDGAWIRTGSFVG
jgi:hypothetical protein